MRDALAFEIPSTSFPFLLAVPPPDRRNFSLAPKRRPPLLGVQLDDELFVERGVLHVIAFWHRYYFRLEAFAVHFQPWHAALALRYVARIEHHGVLVHVVFDRDFVAYADQVR